MTLLSSDGVVAFYLLNDCAQALKRGPLDDYSAHCLKALDALLSAAQRAGVQQGVCAELRTWLALQPDVPRALVLAVVVGAAVSNEDVDRITAEYIEPYLPEPEA